MDTQTTVVGPEGGTLTSSAGDTVVVVPPGAVVEPTILTLTRFAELSYLTNGAGQQSEQSGSAPVYVGNALSIEAVDTKGLPVTVFPLPITIEIWYQDSDWIRAGVKERSLKVWGWNGGRWVEEWPCQECQLRWDEDRLVVQVNHLGSFVLAGESEWHEQFLPLAAYAGQNW